MIQIGVLRKNSGSHLGNRIAEFKGAAPGRVTVQKLAIELLAIESPFEPGNECSSL